MIKNIIEYIHILCDWLETIQSSVDWMKFFTKNMKLLYDDDDKKLFTKIQSLLWSDKSIEKEEDFREKYFIYYTELFNKDDYNYTITVQILLPHKSLPEHLYKHILDKINVVHHLLSVMQIKYIDTNKISNDYNYLLPIGSIGYNNINEMLKSYTGKIIHDNSLWNFEEKYPDIVNIFKIKIFMIEEDKDSIDDIIDCKLYIINK